MDGSDSNCVCLSAYSRETHNVAWSPDQRIAVTTPDVVFVCSLKVPCALDDAHKESQRPAVNITTAHPPPNNAKSFVSPSVGYSKKMMEFVDPVFVGTNLSHDLFKTSDWSPAGCTTLGGCLLTSLTSGGQLLLYSPPHSLLNMWKLSLNLSSLLTSKMSASPLHISSPYKHMLWVCTAFSWLPHALDNGEGQQAVVVAMAMRSAHIMIVAVPMPVTGGKGSGVHPVSVCRVPACDGESGWVSSVKWNSTQRQGLTVLAVGCTDGRVFNISWPEVKVQCVDDLKDPTITLVWSSVDSVPIHQLAWQKQEGDPVLVFNKGPCLFAISVSAAAAAGKKCDERTVCVAGHHSLPVSGLSALPDGSFISSALDGTVQLFTLPLSLSLNGSHDSHVVPTPVETCMSGVAGTLSIQGVSVSSHGLVAAFSVNQPLNQAKKQSSYLYFIKLVVMEQIERHITNTDCGSSWDIIECLRQFDNDGVQFPSSLTETVRNPLTSLSGTRDRGLQIALFMKLILRLKPEDVAESRQQILYHNVTDWLREWTQSMDVAMDTESQLDNESRTSLYQMSKWLQKYGYHGDGDSELIQQVLSKLPSEASHGQLCSACGERAMLINPFTYSCANGHDWNLCPLTFCLVGCSKCHSCVQCGWEYNSIDSLKVGPESWCFFHLNNHMQCIFCGGYFEQVT